jgi:hypothetical protein
MIIWWGGGQVAIPKETPHIFGGLASHVESKVVGDGKIPDGEKEVIFMDMGSMVGGISIPLISSSCQLEGIKEEASMGSFFFYFSRPQLQKMDMIKILGAHPPSKSNLIPSSLSNQKSINCLASREGSIVCCQDEVEGARDTFLEFVDLEVGLL